MAAKPLTIAVIPGDGTGPEVIAEGLKVLRAAASVYGLKYKLTRYNLGGERYLKSRETLPDSVLSELREHSAIYLGAIGHPEVKPGILEQGILLKLRFELDQYVNLRPVKLYPGVPCPLRDKGPADIDFIVIRENTEGLYVGSGGFLKKGTPDEVAIQESINTRRGVERVIRYAFQLARKLRRKKLTLGGKTNVLTYAFDLWERTFVEVAREFPRIETEYLHVDAISMWMITRPERFDVIVTDNMFGDIITDLGAALQGGLGLAAGGNLNPEGVSMFEPIGGSAPKYAGKGAINPLAAILALKILLEHQGYPEAARGVERAVVAVIPRLKSLAAGKMGFSTRQVGDLVANALKTKDSLKK
jgi:3-isopropylmalate dehydrogenase